LKKFLILTFCLFALTANAQNPTLKIKQFDGRIFDLSKQNGKVTIITFWAQWCSNCKREMPILNRFYKKNKARGLEVVAISIDRKSQRAKARQFARNFDYPTALAENVIDTSFSQPKFIPTYYLIGKNGEFLGKVFDREALSEDALNRVLGRYLGS
jgi:thiol-disulfide isomerase/thioredoxin